MISVKQLGACRFPMLFPMERARARASKRNGGTLNRQHQRILRVFARRSRATRRTHVTYVRTVLAFADESVEVKLRSRGTDRRVALAMRNFVTTFPIALARVT